MTINPLESNEMTFVPSSPPESPAKKSDENSSSRIADGSPPKIAAISEKTESAIKISDPKTIANTTIIVNDEVNTKLLMLNNGQVLKVKKLPLPL